MDIWKNKHQHTGIILVSGIPYLPIRINTGFRLIQKSPYFNTEHCFLETSENFPHKKNRTFVLSSVYLNLTLENIGKLLPLLHYPLYIRYHYFKSSKTTVVAPWRACTFLYPRLTCLFSGNTRVNYNFSCIYAVKKQNIVRFIVYIDTKYKEILLHICNIILTE